jgi:hypothetical protein
VKEVTKRKVTSRSQKEIVIRMYVTGYSPKDISCLKNYHLPDVEYTIHIYIHTGKPELKVINRPLGHKSIPYYRTEDEMLDEPVYTYESLSESEKKIYNESRKN